MKSELVASVIGIQASNGVPKSMATRLPWSKWLMRSRSLILLNSSARLVHLLISSPYQIQQRIIIAFEGCENEHCSLRATSRFLLGKILVAEASPDSYIKE